MTIICADPSPISLIRLEQSIRKILPSSSVRLCKQSECAIREAKKRGYEVTAVTRPASVHRLEESYPVIAKDIFELTTEDLRGFDVVVNAFGTNFGKPGNENQNSCNQ